jgi:hypothetical protein
MNTSPASRWPVVNEDVADVGGAVGADEAVVVELRPTPGAQGRERAAGGCR